MRLRCGSVVGLAAQIEFALEWFDVMKDFFDLNPILSLNIFVSEDFTDLKAQVADRTPDFRFPIFSDATTARGDASTGYLDVERDREVPAQSADTSATSSASEISMALWNPWSERQSAVVLELGQVATTELHRGLSETGLRKGSVFAEFFGSASLEALLSGMSAPPSERDRTGTAPLASEDEVVSLSMALPTDDLFSQQWHLQNNTAGLLDLNLTAVWDGEGPTYTGAGVDVAVIDDGVQRAHHDLDDNYSSTKDWDFYGDDTDPSGVDGNDHGTAVAGIIASENNGTGTVGIAYGATIFGFRVKSNGSLPALYDEFLVQLREAVKNASGEIRTAEGDRTADVVNMSNGTQINSNFYDKDVPTQSLPKSVVSAFEYGAENGRHGLGTLFVKSAGNGRGYDHDANGSEWNASRYSISVAAVNQDGFVSSYSTEGANLFVSAFGTLGQVVTTDRLGAEGYNGGTNPDYMFEFNGTSSAAPMVSGVIALMLEANPELGWRDVQDILVNSARHVGSTVGSSVTGSEENAWLFNGAENWNGGGLHFSKDYGFGLVDAHAAVRLAETWGGTAQTSANDALHTVDLINSTVELLDNSVSYNFTPGEFLAETIEVTMTYSHTWIGDMSMVLTSASGTSINLIKSNYGGNTAMTSKTYTWSTNAFWGEDTSGTWKITLTDAEAIDTWTITDLKVSLWGDSSVGNDSDNRFILTNEFSDYAGTWGHSTALDAGTKKGTLNAAAVTTGSIINLSAGTATIDGVTVTLANFSIVYGGDGADMIVGNADSVLLSGMRGNDQIIGGSGNETLHGRSGDDMLDGGAGSDKVYGGTGNDTLRVNDQSHVVSGETYSGGDGTGDILQINGAGSFDFSTSTVNSIEELKFNTADDQVASFNASVASTWLVAKSLVIDAYHLSGVENIVRFLAAVDATLEGLTFRNWRPADHALELIGGTAAQELIGSVVNDAIDGGAGDDTLEGGIGRDEVRGGAGNDTLRVSDPGDVVSGEIYDGGEGGGDILQINGAGTFDFAGSTVTGIEEIKFNTADGHVAHFDASVASTGLAANTLVIDTYGLSGVQNVVRFLATGDATLAGLTFRNWRPVDHSLILIGGEDAQNLIGSSANDTIEGGGGDDTLAGGEGGDTYIYRFGDGSDRIVELAGAAGADVLRLEGIARENVILHRQGNTLEIHLPDGAVISVDAQVDGGGLEMIVFDGGDAMNSDEIADAIANQAPVPGEIDFGTYYDDDTLTFTEADLLAGSYDADGDALHVSGLAVSAGDLVQNPDGSWTYVPEPDRDAEVNISFSVSDGTDEVAATAVLEIVARAPDQMVLGGNGDNLMQGDSGHDTLFAGNGSDVLNGADGDDFLTGGNGNDVLHGGAGDDQLFGGNGKDRLVGGVGNDLLVGGKGPDVFVFEIGEGEDTISDFQVGLDVIELSGLKSGTFAALQQQMVDTDAGVLLDLGDADESSILLAGVARDRLGSDNFFLS